jgi:hypothetical protein
MLGKKITLSTIVIPAIIFASTLTASAATGNHGGAPAHQRAVYNRAPPEAIITNQCLPTDNPCRTKPDGW